MILHSHHSSGVDTDSYGGSSTTHGQAPPPGQGRRGGVAMVMMVMMIAAGDKIVLRNISINLGKNELKSGINASIGRKKKIFDRNRIRKG